MPSMEAVTPEMFDDIFPLLQSLNPSYSREKWRALVDYPWRADGDGLGYALVEKGEVVGFISTLYSSRNIEGREVRLCNTAHWVVRPDYRAEGLKLLVAVMRQREVTLTNLTSTRLVSELMQRLGFQLLDRNVRLLFPQPTLPGAGPVISVDHDVITATVSDEHRTIFDDHQTSECRHAIVRDGSAYCYLVYTVGRRTMYGVPLSYCHIHYISDPALFRRYLPRINWFFLRRERALFLAVDERMMGEQSGWFSRLHPLGVPRYYRSSALTPGQVDNLYTELVLGV